MGKERKRSKRITQAKLTQEERRLKVARMYSEGHVYYTIATILDIAITTVYKDIAEVRKEWIANRLGDYDAKIDREVAGIEYQESELWAAWHRSCQLEVVQKRTTKRKLVERTQGKGKDKTTTSEMVVVAEDEHTETRQMIGDPRFMAEITKLRELRCRLLGLLEDEKPTEPIINIWQSLQDMRFDRDRDEIEEKIQAVRMLPSAPTSNAGLDWPPPRKEVAYREETPNGFTEVERECLDDDSTLEPPPTNPDDTPLDVD